MALYDLDGDNCGFSRHVYPHVVTVVATKIAWNVSRSLGSKSIQDIMSCFMTHKVSAVFISSG